MSTHASCTPAHTLQLRCADLCMDDKPQEIFPLLESLECFPVSGALR